ncbi:DddA-like double-stranded DNA deaminase toxin [Kribbella sp. NPDC051586]|uniref:DddA-like double-stranded DNA deaminase toxin n=1 Tax=Kribbella sp. NPDC051586 TaxID=3364118 RepID=UPI00379DF170
MAEQLLASLNQVPRVVSYLHDRAGKLREAAAWIGSTSNNPNARIAAMQLHEAARRCDEAAHYLTQAESRARQWVEQMVSGGRAVEPSHGPTTERPLGPGGSRPPTDGRRENASGRLRAKDDADKAPGTGDSPTLEDLPRLPKLSDEEARRLLDKLPVRGQKFGQREKTRGIWRDDRGTEYDLVSGRGEDVVGDASQDLYRQAEEFAIEHRLGNPPGTLSITSHVEIKFAMLMWRRGIRDATIVINNLPCKGDSSCEEWLDKFLPPGAKLTIHGPDNFKQTYPKPPPTGGA